MTADMAPPVDEIERHKLEIEREKLRLEHRKLNIELWKAWASAAGIAVPLIVVVLTLYASTRVAHQQAREQFELKAAEIVMQGKDPDDARGRGRALRALFPDRLPQNFAEQLAPLIDRSGFDRRWMLELLLAHPTRRADVVRLWTTLFPDDANVIPAAILEYRSAP